MKRRYTVLLAIVFLVLFYTNVFIYSNNATAKPNTSAYGDLEFEFSNDNLYTNENPSFDTSYNVRNESSFSGNYSATYSFENETDGTSGVDIEFIDIFQKVSVGTATIINQLDNHYKVIEGYSDSAYYRIYNTFDSIQISGTIELWMRSNNTAGYSFIQLRESVVSTISIFWVNDIFYYDNGTWQELGTVVDNTWYHIRIDFDCITDTLDIYLNGLSILTDGNFKVDADSIDQIYLTTGSAIEYLTYYDAIGYSWDTPNHYTFDDRPLYSYFDNSVYPYLNWDYNPDLPNTFAVFDDFVSTSGQYLRMNDGSNGGVSLQDNWGKEIIEGIISFDFRIEDGYNGGSRFELRGAFDDETFKIESNQLIYDSLDENITQINDNQWYNIEINFDCIAHLLDVFINNTYMGSYAMNIFIDSLIKMWFNTGFTQEKNFDIDNLFYSFGYTIGDNMLPDKSYSNYYQTDNYEFTMDTVDTLLNIGGDNPLDWVDIESGGDLVNIARQGYNGLIYIEGTGNGENNGIEKTDFNINNTFVEIDIGFEFLSLTDPTGYSLIEIYSNDSTLVLQLNITTTGLLQYYNGSDFITINSDITINTDYRLDFIISYELSYCFLDLYVDTLLVNNSYSFALLDTDKIGLESIIFESYTFSVNQLYTLIDYIGIETNSYYPNESSFVKVDLNVSYNIKQHNLLTLEVNGNISVLASFNTYTPLGYSSLLVDNVSIIESELYFTNSYDNYIENYDSGSLIFYLNSNFSLTSININGVLLTEGVNEYFPYYYYGNVDIDVSYWYVSGNNLNYFLNCNDNNTEYIKIGFDVNDIATFNNTFLFSGSNYNIFGRELGFNFNGGKTLIIGIDYGNTIQRIYYPSDKILISFDILITDDNNYFDYNATGFFTDFIVRPSSESDIDITTSNFLDALTPLLFFILLPSLLVIYSLNKVDAKDTTREKLFVPVLAVFCFIAYVFAQIELWMLFIAILGFATLFISNRGDT